MFAKSSRSFAQLLAKPQCLVHKLCAASRRRAKDNRSCWIATASGEALESRQLLALVGNAGDLYVSGSESDLIYEVNPTSGAIVGSASANGGYALGIRFDSSGNLYVV